MQLIRYFDIKEVQKTPIEVLAKRFASDVIKLFQTPIIGIGLGLPKQIDGKYVFPSECLLEPQLTDYYILFFNDKTDIINKELYEQYLPDYADQLTKLNKLAIQTLNELSNVTNLEILDHESFFREKGIDMDVIYGFPKQNDCDYLIEQFKTFLKVIRRYETAILDRK